MKPKHKAMFTRYDGLFVKIYQEALDREAYHVHLEVGRIVALLVVLALVLFAVLGVKI